MTEVFVRVKKYELQQAGCKKQNKNSKTVGQNQSSNIEMENQKRWRENKLKQDGKKAKSTHKQEKNTHKANVDRVKSKRFGILVFQTKNSRRGLRKYSSMYMFNVESYNTKALLSSVKEFYVVE